MVTTVVEISVFVPVISVATEEKPVAPVDNGQYVVYSVTKLFVVTVTTVTPVVTGVT